MSDDWQIGDLALCIKQGEWRYRMGKGPVRSGPAPGSVHRVRDYAVWNDTAPTLWFDGWPGTKFVDGFLASRFVKVTPPEEMAGDELEALIRSAEPLTAGI